MKVMTVLGTRPEIIRLSRVIVLLDLHVKQLLVHTGQNYDYELNQIFFEDLGIRKPDYFLEAAGKTACETIGQLIVRVDEVIQREKPDAMLVLGDTNSCLAAYAAKRRQVPVFHMEAGNRCFDERVPEEINRRIVDHISDINMPYSGISREYLLREGIPPERIIKTGSPMYEVLHHYLPRIIQSDILARLKLDPGEYFVVSCHREENIEKDVNILNLLELLEGLVTEFGLRVIFTTHPRTRKRLEGSNHNLNSLIELHKPFCFTDYVKLQMNAKAVLSDSGTITEESSIMNFPALNIREAHERPEGMEEGSVMLVGQDWPLIKECIYFLQGEPRGEKRSLNIVEDYSVPNVSEKVLRILFSYVGYVNRGVLHKN